MRRYSTFFSLATLLVLTALSVVGYFYIDNKLNPEIAISTLDTTATNKPIAQTNRQQSSSPSFQVQGAQSNAPQNNQPTLPGPAQFTVYEQYSEAQNTQFIDVLVGYGQEIANGNSVAVVYSGYLTNGQLFDRSRTNEQNQIEPFEFTIGEGSVIQGWENGLIGMKVGGQRRLIIPSQLGYGAQGAGEGAIPPNSMLIFDVELVSLR